MPKIKIVNDYMNLRKGDILDIADVGEGVTRIYESRDIAVRVDDDTPATRDPDAEDAPEIHTRRTPGPRENKSRD